MNIYYASFININFVLIKEAFYIFRLCLLLIWPDFDTVFINPKNVYLIMHIAEQKKYTEADYNLLEEGAPFQLINGDLITSPAPVSYHQILSIRLSSKIHNFLENNNNNGICLYAPVDVVLNDENIFQPDLIYISAERKTELLQNRIMGAPDLVIEILSPSTAYYDLRQKKDFYERYGVKEYLIIDPIKKDAELYILENKEFVLKQKSPQNGLISLTTLPGLQIDLQKLFV